jgi:Na+/melibiose symporter-like transporter
MRLVSYLSKLALATGAGVLITFILAYIISFISESNFPETAFYVALALTVVGALTVTRGNSSLRSKPVFPGNEQDIGSSMLELERESRNIQSEGTLSYVLQNRIADFPIKRIVLLATGIVSIIAINLIY